jgi:ketosteroid isomerase-like protein
MSKENFQLYLQAIDAINRRDLDAFLKVMDEEVEAVSRIVAIEGGLHGHAGIRRWWSEWFSAFPDYKIQVREVKDFGDVLVTSLRAIGHGATSDLPLEDAIWQATRWRNGKCVWWQNFYTRNDALNAVGVSEQDAHADTT